MFENNYSAQPKYKKKRHKHPRDKALGVSMTLGIKLLGAIERYAASPSRSLSLSPLINNVILFRFSL